MHHAMPVCRVQRSGDRDGDGQCFIERDRTARDARGERFAFQVLHDQEVGTRLVADIVQCADARIAERRHRPSLSLEPLLHLGVVRPVRRQHLDRHRPRQARVIGRVNLAHAARPDWSDDLVWPESCPGA